MTDELAAIRDAMDKESGRDETSARALADAYVAAHPDQFTTLQDMSIEACVEAVDVFRQAGMEDELWRVETWLLHKYESQTIGGPVKAKVRVPGSEN